MSANRPRRGSKKAPNRAKMVTERPKRGFERKTSKTSKLMTISMKMLDFEGRWKSKLLIFGSETVSKTRNVAVEVRRVLRRGWRQPEGMDKSIPDG